MPWEEELFALLDDLEGRAGALWDAERLEEHLDRSRAEYREVTLAARLAASVDREVVLTVTGVGSLTGRLARVAAGWCLLRGAGPDWIVVADAVTGVQGASDRALPEVAWSPVARLGIGSVLRRLADAGAECVLHQSDGHHHLGVIERIGADFVELSTGEQARRHLIALSAVAAIRSTEPS